MITVAALTGSVSPHGDSALGTSSTPQMCGGTKRKTTY